MKRTQIKDAIRNIGKKKISFISICFIVFLGVGCFLWAGFVKDALIKSATEYYKETHFADVEMVCSLGIEEEEIEEIRKADGVRDVEGVIQSDATLAFGMERKKLTALSLTERINTAKVIDGRLPQGTGECALDESLMISSGISIGDKVKINSKLFPLTEDEFTVVGKITHPSYMRNGRENYAVFAKEAFDAKATRGLYAKAAVSLDIPENIGIFSGKYNDIVSKRAAELDDLSATLEFTRLKNETEAITSGKTDISSIEGAVKQLPTAMTRLNWLTTDRQANVGYVDVASVIKSMGTASGSFASLFLVVGAIVCFSTMAIIVNEQKKLIGATKAFGFYDKEIYGKYSIFGVAATVIGILLGLGAAYLFEIGMLSMFGNSYAFGVAKPVVSVPVTIVVFVIAVVLSVVTTLVACKSVIKKPAAALMSGNDDQKKKTAKVKSRAAGSVFSRLVTRNMRAEISRVIVSIAIILGSVGIIGVGFTMKFGFDGMMQKEYSDVIKYDLKISYSSLDDSEKSQIEEIFENRGASYVSVCEAGHITMVGEARDAVVLISADDETLEKFFAVKDVKTGKPLTLPSDGILVQRRFAEVNHLKVGDRIAVYDSNFRERLIRVRGVFQNYIGKYAVISKEAQSSIMKENVDFNSYYVLLNGNDKKTFENEVSAVSENISFESGDNAREFMNTFSTIINVTIMGLTFVAILMSVIILTNLMNIFISKKKKDLAIMRINGFSVKEAISYLTREVVIMNVIGLASGIVLGGGIGYLIMRLMEQPGTQLVRTFSFAAWAIAIVVEAAFSIAITSIIFRKVKKLKPTDAL